MNENGNLSFPLFLIRKKIDEYLKFEDKNNVLTEIHDIIESTDTKYLEATLKLIYKYIGTGDNDDKSLQSLSNIILSLLNSFQHLPNIHCMIRNSFIVADTFPYSILDKISKKVSILLTISLFNSQYKQESIEYFSRVYDNTIGNEIFNEFPTFHIEKNFYIQDNSIIHTKCDLNTCINDVNEIILTNSESTTLNNIISELDADSLKNLPIIMQKISLLDGITVRDCSELLYSLANSNTIAFNCINEGKESFHLILSNIQSMFLNLNIHINDIIHCLDIENITNIENVRFDFIFEMLSYFNNKEPINSDYFLSNWKNSKIQFHFLNTIAQNIVNIDLQTNTDNIQQLLNEYDISDEICNKCWANPQFCRKIIDLSSNHTQKLKSIFSNLQSHSILILLNLFSTNKTYKIMQISKEMLSNLLFPNTKIKKINMIWKNTSDLLLSLFPQFQITREFLENILPIFDAHASDFIEHCSFEFLIDIINYSIDNYENILVSMIKSFTEIQLLSAADQFMRKTIQENSLILPKTVFVFFSTIHDLFDDFSLNTKLFIRFSYTKCTDRKQFHKNIDWVIDIDETTQNNSLKDAKELLYKLLDEKITPKDYYLLIYQNRMHNHLFFQQSVELIISELLNTSQRQQIISKTANLLISSKNFTFNQIQMIVNALLDNINKDDINTANHLINIIKECFNIFAVYDKLILQLANEPKIANIDQEVFSSIIKQKIIITKNEPNKISSDLKINDHLARFSSLPTPPFRVIESMRQIKYNPQELMITFREMKEYADWIALEAVKIVEQNPILLDNFVQVKLSSKYKFILVEAASFRALTLIISTNFEDSERNDQVIAHNLMILGLLISELSLRQNISLQTRCIDLKSVIIYAISQGKLSAVIPFVVSILHRASSFFAPPNPYTSGILHVLAGVYSMPSLKMTIKNCIRGIFDKFSISLSNFDNIPRYFPSKTTNNSDFLITPFSLKHLISQNEIDKMIALDDNVLMNFISKNLFIPNNLRPELIQNLKTSLSDLILDFIKSESKKMTSEVSSTASELIYKDFTSAKDQQSIPNAINRMTNQLSSCLTLFTAQSKLNRILITLTSREAQNDEELEIMSLVAEKNYDWVAQFLRDLVTISSEKEATENCQTFLVKNEQKKNLSIKTLGCFKPNLQQQDYMVYEDLYNIQISIQPFNKPELQQMHDVTIQPDVEFMKFLEPFSKLIPIDSSIDAKYDTNYHENAIANLMSHMPKLRYSMITSERFQSILKTFFVASTMLNHDIIDNVICDVIKQLMKIVTKSMIDDSQSYVEYWLKTSIRSVILISCLVNHNIIKIEKVDEILTDLLNVDPFNAVNAIFVINFIHTTLIKEKSFRGEQLIRSLTAVCTVMPSFIEDDLSFMSSAAIKIKESIAKLKEIYDYKLKLSLPQILSPKAQQDLQNVVENVKELVNGTSNQINEEIIAMMIKNESFETCIKVIQSHFDDIPVILNGIVELIRTNVDDTKIEDIFKILRFIFDSRILNYSDIAKFLHKIRPIECPSFSFAWIQLMATRDLLGNLVISNEKYLASLMTDFVKSLSSIDRISNKFIFDKLYISFLRLLLVIVHDHPQFIANVKSFFFITFPLDFVQVKNILNSVTIKPQTSIIDIQKLADNYDVDINVFEQEKINIEKLKKLVTFIEDKCANQIPLLFVLMRNAQKLLPDLITALSDICDPHTSKIIFEMLVDMLDFDENEESINARISLERIIKENKNPKNTNVSNSEIVIRALLKRVLANGPIPPSVKNMMQNLLKVDGDAWKLETVKNNAVVQELLKEALDKIHI